MKKKKKKIIKKEEELMVRRKLFRGLKDFLEIYIDWYYLELWGNIGI